MRTTVPLSSVFLVLVLLTTVLPACRKEPPRILARDAWTWATVEAQGTKGHHEGGSHIHTGAVYLVLRNEGGQEDALVGAETEAAEGVELHHTTTDERGVATMRRVDRVPLPPGEEVAFRPGGLHLMLIGLRQDLQPGETFALTLRFEKSPPLTVPVQVRAP